MEGEKLERQGNLANADENEATALGDLIAGLVAGLGSDTAMMWGSYAPIRPVVDGIGSGRPRAVAGGNARGISRPSEKVDVTGAGHLPEPLNSASVCEQSARPHFAQQGIRSK